MASDLFGDQPQERAPSWHEVMRNAETNMLISAQIKQQEHDRQVSMLRKLLPPQSRIFTVIRERDDHSYYVSVLMSSGVGEISDITPTVGNLLDVRMDDETGFIEIKRGQGNVGMVISYDLGHILHDDPTAIKFTNL